ncbi:hypothetical protein CB0940_04353 [Cercospora beticola]|uniref:6-methylsalicylate decarboxylase n=1 Tax=Cercospora beticola TaxID=122368 RepID=A0A2G5HMH5_CERBT|nr:hypothetical protein CB0940_04353 [Cercospora beticola]PIA93744.1 hypothetical protein CB0940_04353 [Cercospora beticola]WPB01585.1 hypothetical protein RHO25_006214 [Cercospora beticola]CAK1363619.1 unnamed protein product [Cercospora beticola]
MASGMPHKIDVHSHFLPPVYQEALKKHGHANPDGMPYVPGWSAEEHLALMDKLNISKSILSISSPGCHILPGDDDLARSLTRDCNKYASDLKKQYPTRFGYFAALPLPDVEGSLEEIPKAISEGCDGFVFMTNTHGIYLGDSELDPIFDELNRRKALLFIHPTTPQCPCSPEAIAAGEKPVKATPFAEKFPTPMLDFFFDTARVVSNLFMSGTIKRCPYLRIILPHLGGASPPLLSRWTGFGRLVPGPWQAMEESDVVEAYKTQIWFDMAGFAFPSQIRSLLYGVGVPHSRLMYGSDFPFTRADGVELLLGQMDSGVKELFNEEEVKDLYHRNAEKLLALNER